MATGSRVSNTGVLRGMNTDQTGILRAIVISSIRPELTSGGHITLHRHLVGQSGIQIEVYGNEPDKLTPISFVRRIFGRLRRTRFHRIAEDFWALWDGRWLDGMLPRQAVQDSRTVVLTVAHGDACMAALRFARKHRLPLVTFFHDWWPDIPDVHGLFRRRLEKNFRRLYQGSAAALCVSEGMKTILADHPYAPILYPIPHKRNGAYTIASPMTDHSTPFRVFCAGNLSEYGSMLGDALQLSGEHKSIRIEVRGANPDWPAHFCEAMRARGLWKDFVPRKELDAWLAEADAFLVPMVFDTRLRRRMETSFPSKLTEFAQLQKPLVVWGPNYCSAVKWAQQGNRALNVTDSNPVALSKALEDLAASPGEQQRLAMAVRQAAQTDFNPDKIQAQFIAALRSVLANV